MDEGIRPIGSLLAWLCLLVPGAWADYGPGLKLIPRGGNAEIDAFVEKHMEPLHAVAVGVAGKGTKRHTLLEKLGEDSDLEYLVPIGVQYGKGPSSLVCYTQGFGFEEYSGRWTFRDMKAWLSNVSYPLVNRVGTQFTPPKYFTKNPYGVLLVVRPLAQPNAELTQVLEKCAAKYRSKFKVTYFAKATGTADLCERYGVLTTDELLLIENPREVQVRNHSNVPLKPKYRSEGVSPRTVESFFQKYAAGQLPRYYMSQQEEPAARDDGIRILTGQSFVSTVSDPKAAVLVGFVSQNCPACLVFEVHLRDVARMLANHSVERPATFDGVVVAMIDQTLNEHPEIVMGSPMLRFWPRGRNKTTADFHRPDVHGAPAILKFLEARLEDDAQRQRENRKDQEEEKKEASRPASRRRRQRRRRARQNIEQPGTPFAAEGGRRMEEGLGDVSLDAESPDKTAKRRKGKGSRTRTAAQEQPEQLMRLTPKSVRSSGHPDKDIEAFGGDGSGTCEAQAADTAETTR
eukprot:TRINITY_DN81794_c0_g1_i1.p1 TRINITY_DN81794_c0_g1~~TRINITY_DN81794_c0_g1_i1.p1  ORF type:complete len:517 (+),score=90.35 TRINITY_DN81794_c0_g1_i1:77-1627(+)